MKKSKSMDQDNIANLLKTSSEFHRRKREIRKSETLQFEAQKKEVQRKKNIFRTQSNIYLKELQDRGIKEENLPSVFKEIDKEKLQLA